MGAVLAPVVEFIDLTGDDNNCDNIEMAVGEVQKQVGSEVEVIEILESPRKEGEVQEWAEVEVVGCFVEIPESPPIIKGRSLWRRPQSSPRLPSHLL